MTYYGKTDSTERWSHPYNLDLSTMCFHYPLTQALLYLITPKEKCQTRAMAIEKPWSALYRICVSDQISNVWICDQFLLTHPVEYYGGVAAKGGKWYMICSTSLVTVNIKLYKQKIINFPFNFLVVIILHTKHSELMLIYYLTGHSLLSTSSLRNQSVIMPLV